MHDWLIVADDVTGALDSAVGFAGTGLVEYGVRVPDADVAAVSTGSRALPAPPDGIPDRAVDERFARLFVKIDSTVRGWPAEHTAALLRRWHPGSTAVVCPAAPALGRAVVDGRVLVHGEPASRTAAGRDPVAPVRIDRLPQLFDAPLTPLESVASAIGRAPAVVVDASTAEDLAELAAIIDAAGPRAVPVGSAGLAAALGDRRARRAVPLPHAREVVVLVTSAHPVSRVQVEALGDQAVVVAAPPLPEDRIGHEAAAGMARATAERAGALLRDGTVDAIVVIGGDGTDALLTSLGATGVEVRGALLPGVPWGRIRGGIADGRLIATKSGGFGHAGTLTDLIRILTQDALTTQETP